jgi:antitoxin VapB
VIRLTMLAGRGVSWLSRPLLVDEETSIEPLRDLEQACGPTLLQKRARQRCVSQLDVQGDDGVAKSTVFTSNRGQAVRLPKAVAFKIGGSRMIVPQGKRWDDLFQNGPRAYEDIMVERRQPAAEER